MYEQPRIRQKTGRTQEKWRKTESKYARWKGPKIWRSSAECRSKN